MKYIRLQSQKIRDRIDSFGGKLYLEFGASSSTTTTPPAFPGFLPDSKVKMLLELREQAEIVIVINSDAIEKNKRRGDIGITYDLDVLRLIDAFREIGLHVGSVVLTHYRSQHLAQVFEKKLKTLGIEVYRHYPIPEYPYNVPLIVSDEGYGRNDYIETQRSLVVVTAPGPGSGKWRPASHSSITSRNAARRPGMPSLRPSLSGICRSSTLLTLPTRRQPQTLTTSVL